LLKKESHDDFSYSPLTKGDVSVTGNGYARSSAR